MKLVIIGAIGYGKVVADIALRCGYTEIVFLDDNESVKTCMGYPVVGKLCTAVNHLGSDFFVAIGNPLTRERVQATIMEKGLRLATLIHPNSVVAETVSIDSGSVVMAGAIINPDSKIGKGCIVNTGASVDHDDVIEDFVHLAVGSHLAGTVRVGKRTWVGGA